MLLRVLLCEGIWRIAGVGATGSVGARQGGDAVERGPAVAAGLAQVELRVRGRDVAMCVCLLRCYRYCCLLCLCYSLCPYCHRHRATAFAFGALGAFGLQRRWLDAASCFPECMEVRLQLQLPGAPTGLTRNGTRELVGGPAPPPPTTPLLFCRAHNTVIATPAALPQSKATKTSKIHHQV